MFKDFLYLPTASMAVLGWTVVVITAVAFEQWHQFYKRKRKSKIAEVRNNLFNNPPKERENWPTRRKTYEGVSTYVPQKKEVKDVYTDANPDFITPMAAVLMSSQNEPGITSYNEMDGSFSGAGASGSWDSPSTPEVSTPASVDTTVSVDTSSFGNDASFSPDP